MSSREGKDWMQDAVKRPGALRKKLHVKEGQNIPAKKLDKALHSPNKLTRQQANLAEIFKHSKK
jgi:hypothetical protein